MPANDYEVRQTNWQLSSIVTNTEVVKFNGNVARQDTKEWDGNTAKQLNEIEVYSSNAENTKRCKKFHFDYGYFTSRGDDLAYHQKKLRLESVTETSCSNTVDKKPPYVFDYEGDFTPGIFSLGVDHWGFYNGKEEENSDPQYNLNIPETTLSVRGTSHTKSFTVGTADREADAHFAAAGILTSITYPTGGRTVYHYEGNTVYDPLVETYEEKVVSVHNPCLVTDIYSKDFVYTDAATQYELILTPGGAGAGVCPSKGLFNARIHLYDVLDRNNPIQTVEFKNLHLDITNDDEFNDDYRETGPFSDLFSKLQIGHQYFIELPTATSEFNGLRIDLVASVSKTLQRHNRLVGGLRVSMVHGH